LREENECKGRKYKQKEEEANRKSRREGGRTLKERRQKEEEVGTEKGRIRDKELRKGGWKLEGRE
jgi:hypothetical protein